MAVLTCRDVTIAYDQKIAVRDVSFEVESGDYICIVGENGSGKTSLMRGILGLLQPKSGDILFSGIKRSEIGYLPQSLHIQKDFPATVMEVILSGIKTRRVFHTKAERERAEEVLEKLSISYLKNACYRELSGGEGQRVLLARALLSGDKMLFLDEPAAALDPTAAAGLYKVIDDLNREKVTIMMISHDLQSSLKNAGKILHMGDTVLFYGPTQEYKKSAFVKRLLGGEN